MSLIASWMACAALPFLITGCGPQAPGLQGALYLRQAPYAVPVGDIQIQLQDVPESREPICTGATTLVDMVSQWAKESFVASGGNRRLILRIQEASVREELLPRDHTPLGWFKLESSERYSARVRLSLQVVRPGLAGVLKESTLQVLCQREIPENATAFQRRQLLLNLYETVINSLTKEAEAVLVKIR